jgi:hypothetical protein
MIGVPKTNRTAEWYFSHEQIIHPSKGELYKFNVVLF